MWGPNDVVAITPDTVGTQLIGENEDDVNGSGHRGSADFHDQAAILHADRITLDAHRLRLQNGAARA